MNDDNGAHITKYYLYRDAGDYSSEVSISVATYDGVSLTTTVTGLTAGLKYRFTVEAENIAGRSVPSYETIVVAAQLPPKPTSIIKDSSKSSKTSIHLVWAKVPNTETETTGYILKMAEFGSLDYKVIYYGYNKPQTLEYTATGLKTGSIYSFKLSSLNFNGESTLESDEFQFNACLIPSSFDAPYKITSTSSSITIGWQRPIDDGGCPLIGFAVFRDDGNSGALTNEVNSANDVLVRKIPTLRKLTVTDFPINTGGQPFRFKVTAFNREGSIDSGYASYLLAGVPITPPLSPQLISASTNITHVSVTLPLIADADNGNSAIISY